MEAYPLNGGYQVVIADDGSWWLWDGRHEQYLQADDLVRLRDVARMHGAAITHVENWVIKRGAKVHWRDYVCHVTARDAVAFGERLHLGRIFRRA